MGAIPVAACKTIIICLHTYTAIMRVGLRIPYGWYRNKVVKGRKATQFTSKAHTWLLCMKQRRRKSAAIGKSCVNNPQNIVEQEAAGGLLYIILVGDLLFHYEDTGDMKRD